MRHRHACFGGDAVAADAKGQARSPDRADAMVWAMSELMLGPQRPMPRVRRL